jgi:hypothetical protein
VQRARQLADARKLIPHAACVLLDLGLPDSQGLHGLRWLLQQEPDAAVIVLTGLADEYLGEEAVRAGAQDYLPPSVRTCPGRSGPALVGQDAVPGPPGRTGPVLARTTSAGATRSTSGARLASPRTAEISRSMQRRATPRRSWCTVVRAGTR